MDGRVLPVLLGPTGHPPKTYRIPVPDAAGGPPTVLVYRRVPRGHSRRLGVPQGWKYAFDPEGKKGGGPRWPWSRPDPRPETPRGTDGGSRPDDTPPGARDDTEG